MGNETCQGRRKDGGPCGAPAGPDSALCFVHGRPEAAAAARANGARQAAKLRSIRGRRSRLATVPELVRFTADLIHRVVAGELEADVARCALYGLHLQKGLVEASDLEKRITGLERQLPASGRSRWA